jgi:hypothetical protein
MATAKNTKHKAPAPTMTRVTLPKAQPIRERDVCANKIPPPPRAAPVLSDELDLLDEVFNIHRAALGTLAAKLHPVLHFTHVSEGSGLVDNNDGASLAICRIRDLRDAIEYQTETVRQMTEACQL